VRLGRDLRQVAVAALGDESPGEHHLVEEAVVEDHRGRAAGGVRPAQQVLAPVEVLLGDVGLTVCGHQRLLQEQPGHPQLDRRPGRLVAGPLRGEHEGEVGAPAGRRLEI
jgi:hypothetical protein